MIRRMSNSTILEKLHKRIARRERLGREKADLFNPHGPVTAVCFRLFRFRLTWVSVRVTNFFLYSAPRAFL